MLFHDAATTGDGQVLKGNVLMTHAGMRLTCDSAVFYEASNSFLAYGKVRFTQGDTLSLTGDSLFYDGSSQFARVFHDVVMRHHKMKLKTELLNYDRISGRGFYDVGGEIIDGTNILTSQREITSRALAKPSSTKTSCYERPSATRSVPIHSTIIRAPNGRTPPALPTY